MNAGFFTRPQHRFDVPHDRIGVRWLLVIHACVAKAFAMMRARGDDLCHSKENEITNNLESILVNHMQNEDGLDPDFFRNVTRGSEVENHDARKIGKKPDLIFHLKRSNELWDKRQDALFAECKPVDKKHSLAGHYCAVDKDCSGIARFVIGNYAWAMHESMMIGYVRDGYTIVPHLANALGDTSKYAKLGNPTSPVAVDASIRGQEQPTLYRTTHERQFTWPNGRTATPIDVFHSWHDCG